MKLWRHVIVNTRCSWLHGDERGFRDRDHRIHSSGDYKNPPPPDENEHLRWHERCKAGEPVSFDSVCRAVAVREFVLKTRALGHRVIACSCGDQHLHALVELPPDLEVLKREVGKSKQKVSHVLRDVLPGSVWSAGGEFKRIVDRDHFDNTYDYVRTKQEPGTVVWSHHAEEDWIDRVREGVLAIAADRSRIQVILDFEAHPGLRGYAQTPA